MIVIESHKKKIENIKKKYPDAIILDVTSHAEGDLQRLSPFYPHGDIPVPFTNGLVKAMSVESIWQGLKYFEACGIDTSVFSNSTMQNLKRTTRKYGRILGHLRGPFGDSNDLLTYGDARKNIYIPSYRWMLENKVLDIIQRLRDAEKDKLIILLDYNTNCNPDDTSKPLSHAYLVKAYVLGLYPFEDVFETIVKHNVYVGRHVYEWDTEVRCVRPIEKDNNSAQLELQFDYD